jgi:hypothetical protein
MTHAITSTRNALFRPIAGFSENRRRRIASRQASYQLAHLNGHILKDINLDPSRSYWIDLG